MIEKIKNIFVKKKSESVIVDKDTAERQALLDKNVQAVKKLKELRDLLIYLMDEGSGKLNRKQRRQIREDFIRNDKFAVELIEKAIVFFEKRVTVLNELEKNNK